MNKKRIYILLVSLFVFFAGCATWEEEPTEISKSTTTETTEADLQNLREKVQTSNYLEHTIKPGEEFSYLAQTYYGDPDLYPLIAQYNKIPKSSNPDPGQVIKIPRIPGIPILGEKKESKVKVPELSLVGVQEEKKKVATEVREEKGVSEEKKETITGQAAAYRDHGIELFNQRKFKEAIVELDKVLNVSPNDKVAIEYSFKSYFQYGVALYENKSYLTARDHFKICLRLKENCQECNEYIKMCEADYNAKHAKDILD